MKAFASVLGIALVSGAAASAQHPQAPLTIVEEILGRRALLIPAAASPTQPATIPPAAATVPAAAVPAAASAPPRSEPAPVPCTSLPGAKLFIEPMNGFETYLEGAILKKKVPV